MDDMEDLISEPGPEERTALPEKLLRHGPSLSAALLLHLGLAFLLTRAYVFEPVTHGEVLLKIDVGKLLPARFTQKSLQPAATLPQEPPPSPPVFEKPVPLSPRSLEDALARAEPSDSSSTDSLTIRKAVAPEPSGKFQGYLRDLRQRGLDVVFVFDSTRSMAKLIGQVKAKITGMMAVLDALVPECRLAVVTYRDRGSEYVTMTNRDGLTARRGRVTKFLMRVEVGLGRSRAGLHDWPEAVYDGLSAAVASNWKPTSRKVIVLIGDAPPHQEFETKTYELARKFRGELGGVVHAVYSPTFTVASISSRRGFPRALMKKRELETFAANTTRSIENTFRRIAEAGGGECVRIDREGQIIQKLLTLSFGTKWQGDLQRYYRSLPRE